MLSAVVFTLTTDREVLRCEAEHRRLDAASGAEQVGRHDELQVVVVVYVGVAADAVVPLNWIAARDRQGRRTVPPRRLEWC